MLFRAGTVFAFYMEQVKQYGLIQVLQLAKAGGYHVRVFYRLIDDLDEEKIDSLVQTTDFYYLKNFYPFDLVTGKRVGRFAIPEFVSPPKYMRKCERKQNGALCWYVMEDLRVVKTFKKFDETLMPLSPADTWGIEYIKMRWLDEFTLDNWHELEDKWYENYLKTYEPDKFFAKRNVPPFEQWAKCGRITKNALQEIKLLFDVFVQQMSIQKDDMIAVTASIKQLIDGLNTWNLQYNLIETEEREELVEYIGAILETYHCTDTDDCVSAYRQW